MKFRKLLLFPLVFLVGCAIFYPRYENTTPFPPQISFPQNHSTNIETNNLIWHCSDADNDTLFYDLYFSLNSILDSTCILAKNIETNFYHIQNGLNFETKYFWKVVANDGKNKSESDIWHFSTKAYFPEWWEMQDDSTVIYFYGMATDKSQILSQKLAEKESQQNKSKLIQKYVNEKLQIFIEEMNLADSSLLKLANEIVEKVANEKYNSFSKIVQEIVTKENSEYKTFSQFSISKNEINQKLIKKIKSTIRLKTIFKNSTSYQKMVKNLYR